MELSVLRAGKQDWKACEHMAKRGRKSRWETDIKPNLPLIQEMARTMTEKQIAESFSISYTGTWSLYKQQYPELVETLKKGRQNLVAELRSALIKKAKGYDYTETKETTERVKWPEELYQAMLDVGFTPRQIGEARLVKTEVAHKKMAPDVAAINLALKNYDKENWANDPQTLELKKRELELREKQAEDNAW